MNFYLLRCLLTWENPYCPDRCNQPHDEPDPDYDDGTWSCPTTGTEFWYEGEVGLGEWHEQGRCRIYPTYVAPANAYYEDPWDAGWGACSGCGNWTGTDSLHYDDYAGEDYCDRCYTPEDDPDHESGGEGSHTPRCERCQSRPPVRVDPDSEQVVCGRCGRGQPELVRIPQGRKRVSLAVA